MTPLFAMTTRNAKTVKSTDSAQKLRQTQAEYSAARPAAAPGAKTMMSSSKMCLPTLSSELQDR